MRTITILPPKFYAKPDGTYGNSFSGCMDSDGNVFMPEIPEGLIEVQTAPEHAAQKYDFQSGSWLSLTEEQKAIYS